MTYCLRFMQCPCVVGAAACCRLTSHCCSRSEMQPRLPTRFCICCVQTTRSIMCAFNPAKGVQGVRGFWLRSASLCSLTIVLDPATAACTMSVYMKVAAFEFSRIQFIFRYCAAWWLLAKLVTTIANLETRLSVQRVNVEAGAAALAVHPWGGHRTVQPAVARGHAAGLGAGGSCCCE